MEFDFSPLWISLKSSAIATFFTFFLGIAAARWMLSTRIRGKALIEGHFHFSLSFAADCSGIFAAAAVWEKWGDRSILATIRLNYNFHLASGRHYCHSCIISPHVQNCFGSF
jgi:ABC-type molybdate transport system permease subunit